MMAIQNLSRNNLIENPEISFAEMKCPISLMTMRKVKTLLCGHSFEENHINRHFESNSKCPLCRERKIIKGITQSNSHKLIAIIERQVKLQEACDKYYAKHPEEKTNWVNEHEQNKTFSLIHLGRNLLNNEKLLAAIGTISVVSASLFATYLYKKPNEPFDLTNQTTYSIVLEMTPIIVTVALTFSLIIVEIVKEDILNKNEF